MAGCQTTQLAETDPDFAPPVEEDVTCEPPATSWLKLEKALHTANPTAHQIRVEADRIKAFLGAFSKLVGHAVDADLISFFGVPGGSEGVLVLVKEGCVVIGWRDIPFGLFVHLVNGGNATTKGSYREA